MSRKVWEFMRWTMAASVVWMLGVSHAPPLGTAAVWCALAVVYLCEDSTP